MKVITEHSAYEIDTEAKTMKRFPLHADAADLEGDGDDLDLLRVLRCELGDRAVFLVGNGEPGGAFLRVTTEVKELIP